MFMSNIIKMNLERMVKLILISSNISRENYQSLKMGPRKLRHPPKFVIEPDYQIYRDLLMRWIEVANYSHSEIASLVLQGLPKDIKRKCVEDIGECFLGKKSLHKLIQWLDTTYDNGWNTWLDNARKDEECYETFVPVPRSPLTFKMFIKYKAYPKIENSIYHGVMICPENFEPFELWPGNRFKKYKEVAEYTGKYFKKKKLIDPNCTETHFEPASDYASYIDSNVNNYNVSHKAFSQ